jgi:hypothetical protein
MLPPGQLDVQLPFRHAAPAEQACPQSPQLAGSVRVSEQLAPQSVWVAVQDAAHTPPMHDVPALQTSPHCPQLALSDIVFPHEAPVSWFPEGASFFPESKTVTGPPSSCGVPIEEDPPLHPATPSAIPMMPTTSPRMYM